MTVACSISSFMLDSKHSIWQSTFSKVAPYANKNLNYVLNFVMLAGKFPDPFLILLMNFLKYIAKLKLLKLV